MARPQVPVGKSGSGFASNEPPPPKRPKEAESVAGPAMVQREQGWTQYDDVCLGGTFDHMHAGHKLLLTRAVFLSRRRLVCGVSQGKLLANKRFAEQLADEKERCANVREFLRTVRRGVRSEVGPVAGCLGMVLSEVTPHQLAFRFRSAS